MTRFKTRDFLSKKTSSLQNNLLESSFFYYCRQLYIQKKIIFNFLKLSKIIIWYIYFQDTKKKKQHAVFSYKLNKITSTLDWLFRNIIYTRTHSLIVILDRDLSYFNAKETNHEHNIHSVVNILLFCFE